MNRPLIVLIAVAALLAAGCGSSSKKSSSPGTTTSAPAQTSSSASASGGTVEVKMQNIAFSPKGLTVKAGTTVKWTNDDSVAHNVSGGPLHSPTFNPGGSYQFTFKKAGTFNYVCTIHPGMTGTVIVQ
jgi:plastocyanin